ncbi:unnamed protein product [Ilex paraguariensis]|uniref:Uncharacterized protein n=1 Tax=Ilex paraguariensis TaxID=185542 RepID=A0ABC8U153_9AQUA
MAISTSCCLNLSPSPPNSRPSSLPLKTTQIAWPSSERSWGSRCVIGVACMIIGLEMGSSIGNEETAIASDIQLIIVKSRHEVQRWSDKRACPPWQVNSLKFKKCTVVHSWHFVCSSSSTVCSTRGSTRTRKF